MGNSSSKKNKIPRILIQGLKSSGKTSVLFRLKKGESVNEIDEVVYAFSDTNVETLECGDDQLSCWDIGGRGFERVMYRLHYRYTNGFIYVIDSNDRESLDESLDELVKYVLLDEETKNTVLMVLANKQDIEGCMTSQEVEDALKKKYTFSKHSSHTVFVMPCSAKTGDGLDHALTQFAHQLRLKKDKKAEPGLITPDDHAPNAVESTPAKVPAESHWKTLVKNPRTLFKSIFC